MVKHLTCMPMLVMMGDKTEISHEELEATLIELTNTLIHEE